MSYGEEDTHTIVLPGAHILLFCAPASRSHAFCFSDAEAYPQTM
jgi:hypothetical protein